MDINSERTTLKRSFGRIICLIFRMLGFCRVPMFCFMCFHLISYVQGDIWITKAFFFNFFFKSTPRILFLDSLEIQAT